MIRYALVCGKDHQFEAWFRDSTAFDDQSRDSQIDCPQCGSSEVRKAMMAPAIGRRSPQPPATEGVTSPVQEVLRPLAPGAAIQRPVAMPATNLPDGPGLDDERFRQMRTLLRELHAKVKESAENVGASFPAEARKIHHGDAEARPIYGTAVGADVRALLEEGIEIMPLPTLPDDSH